MGVEIEEVKNPDPIYQNPNEGDLVLPDLVGGDIFDEQSDVDIDSDSLDQQITKEKLLRYKENTRSRKDLSKWAQNITEKWLVVVGIIIFCSALFPKVFFLPESVLITLLTTTTFNIIGLVVIVLKGYFNKE